MEWLNYHHLLYFWTVAREGGITRASEQLHLTQPTISAQVRALEEALGQQLFLRVGRRLVLTEVGQVAYRYAEEIFGLGRELLDTLNERPTGRPASLVVGIADVMAKVVVHRLLEPALALPGGLRLVCREDKTDRLLAALATHELDVVLADAPASPAVSVKAFSHVLGESGVALFGAAALAKRFTRHFPDSLRGAPLLLPTSATSLRRALDHWFDLRELRPNVVAEFDDSALMMVFGEGGLGLFPAPAVLEREVREQYGVRMVGHLPDVRERFYAISVERRLKHPAVMAISEAARRSLFKATGAPLRRRG
jgi:LysR family transcriptional regulator, transcriptional activator of nhaA